MFFAARDAAQSMTSSSVGASSNALSWDNVSVDVLGGWAIGNPTRFTPTIAGWYQLAGAASFNASTGGTVRGVSWLVNGSLPVAATARDHATTAIANTSLTAMARTLPVQLNGSTDYVELAPFQDSGSALDTATGSTRPYVAVFFAGPA
ncbi:hypothetical protein D7231_31780 [Streptomyces klenkii]|uniref:Uncharacterized protein n=1 Tax=Streptomyces klenkii TaxID=1420899 RepID=A0A3B0AL84_9ACTN|nr:hypothetical protein D7231_31780 [Streptomyces klenkii]